MKIKMSVQTNKVGSKVERTLELPWDKDEGHNEKDIEKFAFEWVLDNIEWTWDYVNESLTRGKE